MARNQPEESGSHSGSSTPSPSTYSTSTPSSPATHGTLGANGLTSEDMDLSGMGESAISEAGTDRTSISPSSMSSSISPAQEAARAAQQSATKMKSHSGSSSDAPSPTSMRKKRGNQPR